MRSCCSRRRCRRTGGAAPIQKNCTRSKQADGAAPIQGSAATLSKEGGGEAFWASSTHTPCLALPRLASTHPLHARRPLIGAPAAPTRHNQQHPPHNQQHPPDTTSMESRGPDSTAGSVSVAAAASGPCRHTTYSYGTRFMPSRVAVTTTQSAMLHTPKVRQARPQRVSALRLQWPKGTPKANTPLGTLPHLRAGGTGMHPLAERS